MVRVQHRHGPSKSLSARRAWIEMRMVAALLAKLRVALRKESVDRNLDIDYHKSRIHVALRKESVDRNKQYGSYKVDV